MIDNLHAYNIGRIGAYGSALVVAALVLGGCSPSVMVEKTSLPTKGFQTVHMDFHKKMLAEQKKATTKTEE